MIPHARLTRTGVLPLRTHPIRFAVGAPDGLTSNSWRLWTTRAGDVYIACRDNSLGKNVRQLRCDEDRAWEVWDQPPAVLPQAVIAFRLLFLTSELAVRAEQRTPREWARVTHLEAGPPGKLTAVTVFVTTGDAVLKHESQPSFRLGSLDIASCRRVQVVALG